MIGETLYALEASSKSPLPEDTDDVDETTLNEVPSSLDSSFDVHTQKDTFLRRCDYALEQSNVFERTIFDDKPNFSQKVEAILQLESFDSGSLLVDDSVSTVSYLPFFSSSDALPSFQLENSWRKHEVKASEIVDRSDSLSIDALVSQLCKIDRINRQNSSCTRSSTRKRSSTPEDSQKPATKLLKAEKSVFSSLSKTLSVQPAAPVPLLSPEPLLTVAVPMMKTVNLEAPKLTVTSRTRRRKTKDQEIDSNSSQPSSPLVTAHNDAATLLNDNVGSVFLENEVDFLDSLSDTLSVSLTEKQRLTIDEFFLDFIQSTQ